MRPAGPAMKPPAFRACPSWSGPRPLTRALRRASGPRRDRAPPPAGRAGENLPARPACDVPTRPACPSAGLRPGAGRPASAPDAATCHCCSSSCTDSVDNALDSAQAPCPGATCAFCPKFGQCRANFGGCRCASPGCCGLRFAPAAPRRLRPLHIPAPSGLRPARSACAHRRRSTVREGAGFAYYGWPVTALAGRQAYITRDYSRPALRALRSQAPCAAVRP